MNFLLKYSPLRHHRTTFLLFVQPSLRLFSSDEKKPPEFPATQEYTVNEKEIFSEEKMAEARQSIKDKLKMISQ
jgi:hypothetical protein